MHKLFLVSVLALVPMAANAKIQSNGGSFSAEKGLNQNESFDTQRAAIIAALGDGQTYREIAPEKRRQVVASLERISSLMGGATSISQVPMADRVEVFNEQERINVLLGQARDDSRLVCKREMRVGTRRATTHCLTVAERRRLREQAQDDLATRQIDLASESN